LAVTVGLFCDTVGAIGLGFRVGVRSGGGVGEGANVPHPPRPLRCVVNCSATNRLIGGILPRPSFAAHDCVRRVGVVAHNKHQMLLRAATLDQGRCSPKERSGGTPATRLRQRFLKQFRPTLYTYTHTRQEKLPQQRIFGLVLRYRYSCLSVCSRSIFILLY